MFLLVMMIMPTSLKENKFVTLTIIVKSYHNTKSSFDDTYCLGKNIYHESRGESKRGKNAVAQVTINRLYHEEFPDTICDVVYQKRNICEFSWVCEDNQEIDDIDSFYESLEIANKFINHGKELPELKDALFFHATYVNPKWKYKRISKIGNHIFYGI